MQIVDHWYHPDGTVYALAQLDLKAFTDSLDKMKELNANVRDYVRKNAEKAHMDLEIVKRRIAAFKSKEGGANP